MTDTALSLGAAPRSMPPGSVQRLARLVLFRMLDGIEDGQLMLTDGEGHRRFGKEGTNPGLSACLWIRDPAAYPLLVLGGSVGAGRSYAEGMWATDDLTALIRILARNRDVLARWRKGAGRVMELPGRVHRWVRRNHPGGSRRNIKAHYDLSNEFFGLFLDSSMMYSCAVFESPDTTLEEASIAKLDRICRKLDLQPGDNLLEIGTGWGGLALHAARRYECRVTTTTISLAQYEYARKLVQRENLGDRITVLNEDYRNLKGTFDKLVSVEMIEAVGPQYIDTFFRTCSNLLRPDGLMLLQAITIDDREYERAARSVDFIKHYIFPGSCIPSVGRMAKALATETDLRLLDLEDLSGHYATTLARWRERFLVRSGDIDALGFDERFRRLWEFYFCYCEGGFHERRIGNVHMVLAKPGFRGSMAPAIRGGGGRQ